MDEDARVPSEERDLFCPLVDHSLGLMCVHDLTLCVSARPAAAAEPHGAADPVVLQKPFTVLHLLGKVRQVLDGRDG
jgi:hypothetical protein